MEFKLFYINRVNLITFICTYSKNTILKMMELEKLI